MGYSPDQGRTHVCGSSTVNSYLILSSATRVSRSRPDTGIATLTVEVSKDGGEVVQTGTDVLLVATAPAQEAA